MPHELSQPNSEAEARGALIGNGMALLQKVGMEGGPGRCRSFQASSRLEFELFRDDCGRLGGSTGTNSESSFDDARLAANVLRKVEDRRLVLA